MTPLRLPSGPLSVLCLGAHPDDIEIGCGATILALARTGRATGTHVMFTGTPDRQAEARRAAELFWEGAPEAPRVVNHNHADGRLPSVWNDVKDALEDVAREFRFFFLF